MFNSIRDVIKQNTDISMNMYVYDKVMCNEIKRCQPRPTAQNRACRLL